MTDLDRDQLWQEGGGRRCPERGGLIITFLRRGEDVTHLFPKDGPQVAHFGMALFAELGELRSGDRLLVYQSGDRQFSEGPPPPSGTVDSGTCFRKAPRGSFRSRVATMQHTTKLWILVALLAALWLLQFWPR